MISHSALLRVPEYDNLYLSPSELQVFKKITIYFENLIETSELNTTSLAKWGLG